MSFSRSIINVLSAARAEHHKGENINNYIHFHWHGGVITASRRQRKSITLCACACINLEQATFGMSKQSARSFLTEERQEKIKEEINCHSLCRWSFLWRITMATTSYPESPPACRWPALEWLALEVYARNSSRQRRWCARRIDCAPGRRGRGYDLYSVEKSEDKSREVIATPGVQK